MTWMGNSFLIYFKIGIYLDYCILKLCESKFKY
jgi:hypothetical protein